MALGDMDELRSLLPYQYVLRTAPGIVLPTIHGEVMVGRDGCSQVTTDKSGSMSLSREMIERDVQF
jgi:hypothetical protein